MTYTVLFQTVQFFVSTQWNVKTVPFQTIWFSLSTQFKCQTVQWRVSPQSHSSISNSSVFCFQQYKVRINGKMEQSRKRSSAFSYTYYLPMTERGNRSIPIANWDRSTVVSSPSIFINYKSNNGRNPLGVVTNVLNSNLVDFRINTCRKVIGLFIPSIIYCSSPRIALASNNRLALLSRQRRALNTPTESL